MSRRQTVLSAFALSIVAVFLAAAVACQALVFLALKWGIPWLGAFAAGWAIGLAMLAGGGAWWAVGVLRAGEDRGQGGHEL